MSNFLRHLLRRSLSPTTAAVQPRLASRFESGLASARITEEPRETLGPAPVASQPAASRVPSAPMSFPPPGESPPPAAPALGATPPPTLAQAPFTPALVAWPAVLASPAGTPPPPAILSALAPAVSASVSAEPRAVPSLPPPQANTLLIEHIIQQVREPAPPSAADVSSVAPTADVVRPIAASAPAALSLAPTPASLPLAPLAPIVAGPAPGPTIQVTIGRVDIRAVHAPAAPAIRVPVPARRPLVSLEHYLNQRDPK